jgi:hypothetical protein
MKYRCSSCKQIQVMPHRKRQIKVLCMKTDKHCWMYRVKRGKATADFTKALTELCSEKMLNKIADDLKL